MFEYTEKLWETFVKTAHIAIMLFAVCMIYVHRRVIRAAILGTEMPECPHHHFGKSHKKHTDSEESESIEE